MSEEKAATLFRPAGPDEMKLVAESGYTRCLPRLPGQPIFYPVTNEQYATEITERWSGAEYGAGYVTRFEVKASFMARYSIKKVGKDHHTEWWVPAEDLNELDDNIKGTIEVIHHFRRDT